MSQQLTFEQTVCWFDGRPKAEIWATTWDEPGQFWAMCEHCCAHVRNGLQLRKAGRVEEAEAADHAVGIDTRGLAGKWIDPQEAA